MYGYIYLTYNKINGKIYIGQRKGKYDEKYLGSGVILKRSIERYGTENFENHMVQWCNDKNELNEREIYWIAKYNCTLNNGFGYNIAIGGNGGNTLKFMTNEQKCKRSNKISKSNKVSQNSNDTKHKKSNSMKGKQNSLGYHHKDDAKRKIGAASAEFMKGNKFSAKATTIIYKNKTYEFETRNEFICWFKDNFNISVKHWVYGNVPPKHSQDVKLIKIGNEIKYAT